MPVTIALIRATTTYLGREAHGGQHADDQEVNVGCTLELKEQTLWGPGYYRVANIIIRDLLTYRAVLIRLLRLALFIVLCNDEKCTMLDFFYPALLALPTTRKDKLT